MRFNIQEFFVAQITISGCTAAGNGCNGTYHKVGDDREFNNKPKYRSDSGAIIYWQGSAWRINYRDQTDGWYYSNNNEDMSGQWTPDAGAAGQATLRGVSYLHTRPLTIEGQGMDDYGMFHLINVVFSDVYGRVSFTKIYDSGKLTGSTVHYRGILRAGYRSDVMFGKWNLMKDGEDWYETFEMRKYTEQHVFENRLVFGSTYFVVSWFPFLVCWNFLLNKPGELSVSLPSFVLLIMVSCWYMCWYRAGGIVLLVICYYVRTRNVHDL